MNFHDPLHYHPACEMPAEYEPAYAPGDVPPGLYSPMSYCSCSPSEPGVRNPSLRTYSTSFAQTLREDDEIFYAQFPAARPSPAEHQQQYQVYHPDGTFYPDEFCASPLESGLYSPADLYTPITPVSQDSFLGFPQCETWADWSSPPPDSDAFLMQTGQSPSASDELLHTAYPSGIPASPIEPIDDLEGPAKSHNHIPYPSSSDVKEPVPRLRVRIPPSGNVYPTLTEAATSQPVTGAATAAAVPQQQQQQQVGVQDERRRREPAPATAAAAIQEPVLPVPQLTPAVRRNAVKRLLSRSPSPEPPQHIPSPTSSTASERPHQHQQQQPRKPAMSCFFCRGRKIACGQPNAESEDRTCNQCRRRSLKCEYPIESRRGMRKKKTTSTSMSD